jgi:hypothetical protein
MVVQTCNLNYLGAGGAGRWLESCLSQGIEVAVGVEITLEQG